MALAAERLVNLRKTECSRRHAAASVRGKRISVNPRPPAVLAHCRGKSGGTKGKWPVCGHSPAAGSGAGAVDANFLNVCGDFLTVGGDFSIVSGDFCSVDGDFFDVNPDFRHVSRDFLDVNADLFDVGGDCSNVNPGFPAASRD
jgi:hypothetical protein